MRDLTKNAIFLFLTVAVLGSVAWSVIAAEAESKSSKLTEHRISNSSGEQSRLTNHRVKNSDDKDGRLTGRVESPWTEEYVETGYHKPTEARSKKLNKAKLPLVRSQSDKPDSIDLERQKKEAADAAPQSGKAVELQEVTDGVREVKTEMTEEEYLRELKKVRDAGL